MLDSEGKLRGIASIDPSDTFARERIGSVPIEFFSPTIDGTMAFADDEFDLVTLFGVLAHVVNASYVLSKCARCLNPGATCSCASRS